MNLPHLSIKRPVFITAIFSLIIVLGIVSFLRLGVELLPDVSFPVVSISVIYPGAGPSEVETLISKPIEDKLSSLPGIKNIKSTSQDNVAIIMAEFTLETNADIAEQKVTQTVTSMLGLLPDDIEAPKIRAFDMSSEPVAVLTVTSPEKISPADFYRIAEDEINPRLQQVDDVAFVEIIGGQKREIQVLLDRHKLKSYQFSALQVANSLQSGGKNIPIGPLRTPGKESSIRSLGEYRTLQDIGEVLVSFYGNENPVRIQDIGIVKDDLKEVQTLSYVNGKESLSIKVYRRSKSNTVNVVKELKEMILKINHNLSSQYPGMEVKVVRDGARPIMLNIQDVSESILWGIFLTIIVVFIFLKSFRSTLITGIALPNSLLGAFILMAVAGFTINMMTLLALSLCVGLLIDDAIVVRENIFRHLEKGEDPKRAALEGTNEVMLPVIATTLTVVSVFGSVAFLNGIVGQFFKEFGLTICFAMFISLFDSLTMAPMLSAYLAVSKKKLAEIGGLGSSATSDTSTTLATFLSNLFMPLRKMATISYSLYFKLLHHVLHYPKITLFLSLLIFLGSFLALSSVPKTFVAPEDAGEFGITLEMPPGTDLWTTRDFAIKVDQMLHSHPEVNLTYLVVGGTSGQTRTATIIIQLVSPHQRKMNTLQFKEKMRESLLEFSDGKPQVKEAQEAEAGDWAERPFIVNIVGNDFKNIETTANQFFDKLKNNPNLKDVDLSYHPGNPEFHLVLDKVKAERLGIASTNMGLELRTQIEGSIVGVLREGGEEYDIRTRMMDEYRNLKDDFKNIYIPNINHTLVRLPDVASYEEKMGPAAIHHHNRLRYISVSADIDPNGKGMAQAISDLESLVKSKQVEIPPGISYRLIGDAERFQELMMNMITAITLSVLFIYLVLASLYESFLTPFIIMLVLPLAACGAFYALALMGGILDVYSMIGCILLFGIATKNSILLVDYIKNKSSTHDLIPSIIEAVEIRLRPILMTTIALICGMLPIAIGLNEASKQRTSMGIAVIGGLISSTLLTLIVIPAVYASLNRWRHKDHRAKSC